MSEEMNDNRRIQPHELTYLGGKLSPQPGDCFTSITDLENAVSRIPRNAVLLCSVLCYRLAERNLEDRPKFYNRSAKSISYNYDRMLKLRCLNSASGVNVFNILMSKQRNSHLFDFYQERRGEYISVYLDSYILFTVPNYFACVLHLQTKAFLSPDPLCPFTGRGRWFLGLAARMVSLFWTFRHLSIASTEIVLLYPRRVSTIMLLGHIRSTTSLHDWT